MNFGISANKIKKKKFYKLKISEKSDQTWPTFYWNFKNILVKI